MLKYFLFVCFLYAREKGTFVMFRPDYIWFVLNRIYFARNKMSNDVNALLRPLPFNEGDR